MLVVQIKFVVLKGKDQELRKAWAETTNYIYKNFGSLGSRLHKTSTGEYIAHAQWPDLETYEKEHIWTKEGLEVRDRMRGALSSQSPEIQQKLIVDTDLFKSRAYS